MWHWTNASSVKWILGDNLSGNFVGSIKCPYFTHFERLLMKYEVHPNTNCIDYLGWFANFTSNISKI